MLKIYSPTATAAAAAAAATSTPTPTLPTNFQTPIDSFNLEEFNELIDIFDERKI